MTSQYRHRRTSTPATPFPTLEPGEIAVNTANRQISVGDAATPTLGTPKPLLAIRFFDIAAIYAIGDIVTNADKIWRAIAANGPGSFNAANWELAASQVTIAADPPSNAVAGSMWWDSDNGMLYVRYNDGDSSQWVQATAMPVVDTSAFVAKAGDTMTGELILSYATSPTISLRKQVAGTNPQIRGYNASNLPRWTVNFCDAAAEAGSNQGSNFQIGRFDDAGGFIDGPLYIARSTGSVSVLTDPTIPLGVATKQYVDARAGDAMAYSGMQHNGSMEVSQENGVTAVSVTSAASKYVLDGWLGQISGPGTLSLFKNVSYVPLGYPASLVMNVTVANASPAAGNYAVLTHAIEGYRMSRLLFGTASARSITLGFWVNASRTGLLSGALLNGAANRSCTFSYTVNAANVWEYKTVTIPGDVTGTWAKDHTAGVFLSFTMMAGSTACTTPGVWTAGLFWGAPGTVNCCATTSDNFAISGLVVLPGTQAPAAAQSPLLMRPYDQELLICKRYYQKSYNADVAPGTATAAGPVVRSVTSVGASLSYGGVSFQIPMRANPAVTVYGYAGGATRVSDNNGADLVANSGLASLIGTTGFNPYNGSGVTANPTGQAVLFHYAADARL